MKSSHERPGSSRRTILKGSALFLLGGAAARVVDARAAEVAATGAPPLPWKWVKLDPLEAGRRGYRAYLEKGG